MSKALKSKKTLTVIAAFIALMVLAGATYAWFTAQDEIALGAATAKFDVAYVVEFDEEDTEKVAPGDSITSVWHGIANRGNIPMVVKISYSVAMKEEGLEFGGGMVGFAWAEQCTKIGDAYYLRLEAGETIEDLAPLSIHFDGKSIDNEFIDKAFDVNAVALASQARQDAAASTFGSADVAQKLADLGFFDGTEEVDEWKLPNVELVSAVEYGDAKFTYDGNEKWAGAITGIKTVDWDYFSKKFVTKSVNIKSWFKVVDGEIIIGNGNIRMKNMLGDYTKEVIFSAEGYEDLTIDVTDITIGTSIWN